MSGLWKSHVLLRIVACCCAVRCSDAGAISLASMLGPGGNTTLSALWLNNNMIGVSPGTQSQDTSSYKTPRVVS